MEEKFNRIEWQIRVKVPPWPLCSALAILLSGLNFPSLFTKFSALIFVFLGFFPFCSVKIGAFPHLYHTIGGGNAAIPCQTNVCYYSQSPIFFFFIVVIIIIWPNFISAVEFKGFGLWLDSPIRYKQVS
jgi:hypothetical protein